MALLQSSPVTGFRLSPQQRRLWRLRDAAPLSVYRCEAGFLIEGDLRRPAFREAFRKAVERFEILRTTFPVPAGMTLPLQVIGTSQAVLEEADLAFLDGREQEAALEAIAARLRAREIQPASGPLWHAALVSLSPRRHALLFDLSALCGDAVSLWNLTREIGRLYAELTGAGAEEGEPLQYADLAEWQNGLSESEGAEAGARYWRPHQRADLAGAELPSPTPGHGAFSPRVRPLHLVGRSAADLEALAARLGVSVPATVAALWIALLHRLLGKDGLVLGYGLDGRDYEELEEAVGLLARCVPFACDLPPALSLGELARQVEAWSKEAYEWQAFFEWEEPGAGVAPARCALAFEAGELAAEHRVTGAELSLAPLWLRSWLEPFQAKLSCWRLPGGLRLEISHDARSLSELEALRLALRLETLLARTSALSPETDLGSLELAFPGERHRLLYEVNDTWRTAAGKAGLAGHRLFEQQAAATPEAPALRFEDRLLTYRELNAQANRLAHALRRLGVGPETRVGIFLERSEKLLVAVLGIWKAGGAYVPLEPNQPATRIDRILESAEITAVVAEEGTAAAILGIFGISDIERPGPHLVYLDPGHLEAECEDDLDGGAGPDNLAYLIFTSGSTGTPKGVGIEHRNLVSYVEAACERLALEPGMAYATVTTLAADLGHTSVFPALFSGGCLDVIAAPRVADPAALAERFRQHRPDCLKIVPSHLSTLLDGRDPEAVLPSRRLIFGGEALSWPLLARLGEGAERRVFNHYGPSETTVGALAGAVPRREPDFSAASTAATVPLGAPLAGATAYLLDPHGHPVFERSAGEVFLGGACVGRGYLGRPDLTAERFIPDPFSALPGARLYRTGDLARRLPDGTVEFLGRADFQVKIRGFRVELGEIESALRQLPGLAHAVVLASSADRESDLRLTAYLVPGGSAPAPREIRDFLQQRLPDFMIPTDFVVLERLPLTANGKLDRQALPAPGSAEAGSARGFVAPRNEMEEMVATLWSQILGREPVGALDSFFELGGHSLLATQVISRVRSTCGVEVPLARLFDSPTVAGFAAELEGVLRASHGIEEPPIVPVPREGDLPLSFAQERLWFLDQLQPDTATYNLAAAVRLVGELDEGRLEAAFNDLASRHEVLRTTFPPGPKGPVQAIAQVSPRPLHRIDLRALPAGQRTHESLRLAGEEARRPFDLSRGPLLRASLLILGTGEHILLLTLHHIVADGWSMGVLIETLVAGYGGRIADRPVELPPLPIQYADFAVWQRRWLTGEVLEEQLGYWKEQLAGLPPLLELPLDRPRSALRSARGGRREIRLSAALSSALRELARQEGTTLFMTLAAAFAALLARVSHQADIPVGTLIANRNRVEIEPLIGFFVNTLVLRIRLEDDPAFRDLLAGVRRNALAAYAHQDLPFERLVEHLAPERNLGHTPLFQVLLTFQNAPATELELPGLHLESLEMGTGTAKFDLGFSWSDESGGLLGRLEYSADLFDGTTVERTLRHFEALLDGVTSDAGTRLSQFPLLSSRDRHHLLLEWGDAEDSQEGFVSVCRLFEDQAARLFDACAVRHRNESLTYGELDRRACRLARRLRALGVGPEVRVGLCLERSLDLPAAILGIFKAGGAYVPLDAAYPPDRLAFMMEDSLHGQAAKVIVTTARQREELPDLPWDGVETVLIETLDEPEDPEGLSAAPGDLAYLIYTSGTTGRPKAVLVEHRHLAHTLAACRRQFDFRPGDRMPCIAPFSFDIFLFELFTPLTTGGSVEIFDLRPTLDVDRLIGSLGAASHFHAVPALMRQVVDAAGELPQQRVDELREIFVGGDAVPAELLRDLQRVFPGARIHVLYGPTEAAILATHHLLPSCSPAPRTLLGHPLGAARLALRDRSGNLVPVGVAGEIWIGGGGVTRGYLQHPALTAEKFVPGEEGARWYRTGDLGRWLADGSLEFLGRIDFQVKIRGFRIELGEIEAALASCEGVHETVVQAREDRPGERRLVAYVVPAAPSVPEERVELWPSIGDYFVYDELIYHGLTGDEARNELYRRALLGRVEGKVAVDLGTGGDAILARLCVELGARRVYALDILEETARMARERVAGLGLEDRIRVLHGDARQTELPEPVDVCVSEIVEAIAGAEGAAVVLNDARRFLKPDGIMVPTRAITRLAAATLPDEIGEAPAFTEVSAHYVRKIFADVGREFDLRLCIKSFPPENLLSGPAVFEDLDFRGTVEPEYRLPVRLEIDRAGRLDGFLLWLVLDLGQGQVIDILGNRFSWFPVFFPVFWPGVQVQPGDVVTAVCGAELSSNGIHPDYFIEGALAHAAGGRLDFRFDSRRHDGGYRQSPFYRRLFEGDEIPVTAGSTPSKGAAVPAGHGPLASRLRDHLQERLPGHMLPAAFVFLDALPLSANAKVDRAALPAPDATAEDALRSSVAPRTRLEEQIAGIWRELLGRSGIGIHDSFFELGGHSLLATQVISRVRQACGVEVSLASLFNSPTVAGLALAVGSASRKLADDLPPILSGDLPLSFAQERLWFLFQLEPESPAYNIPTALLLHGELNPEALGSSLGGIVARHEILRATFGAVQGRPVQRISPPPDGPWPLPTIDLSTLPVAARGAEARDLAEREARRPFDLDRGPMLRSHLVRLAANEHLLLLTLHHIVTDAWSSGVLAREMAALYAAHAEGRPAFLPALPLQYARYAQWQRVWMSGETLEAQLAFWRGTLTGVPLRLELPHDRPRPTVATGHGRTRPVRLPDALGASLASLARRHGATLFAVLLAAWTALLSRLSGQEDVVVGTSIANRNRLDVEELIGLFVNLLPLRNRVDRTESFASLIDRVRDTALAAVAHQDLPFERLVEEMAPAPSLSFTPLFQVTLILQSARREPLELPGLRIELAAAEASTAKFDLVLSLAEEEAGLAGEVGYRTDLFDAATVERWMDGFGRMLEAAASEPQTPIRELPLLGEEERLQLLVEWNDTGSAYPHDRCLHELFSEQALASPEAVALELGTERLTYAELEARSNRLARHLRNWGVGSEMAVGILAERSLDLVVGLLGILKAGGYYLPLDPQAPPERLELQLDDAGAILILAPERLAEEIPGQGIRVVLSLENAWRQEPDDRPLAGIATAENLAYLLYTSGSTGTPKGVGVPHRAVVRLVRDNDFAHLPGETFLQLAPLAFDASTLEIWGPLLNGGRLVLMPTGMPSLEELGSALRRHGVTSLWLTAGLFHQMVEHRLDDLAGLHQLLAGGDVLSVPRVRSLREGAPRVRLINGYGPTESTTFAACHTVGREHAAGLASSVPIGSPIRNTQVYVLDRDLGLQPIGVVGELYLGGDGLARGYQNRPDLTAERFVPAPFGPFGARCYRTGDQVRFLPEGRLEFLGRLDSQVKVRGFRIELGEIEAALARHPCVREAVVVVREILRDGAIDKQLAAFFVPSPGSELSADAVRGFLRQSLPEYLIPSTFQVLESLPLTANAKVDRRALSLYELSETSEDQGAPRTPVEELLTSLFTEVLGKSAGIHDSFFDLGGHSLLGTQLVSRIGAVFGAELPLQTLFESPTVAGLAAALEEILQTGSGLPPAPLLEPVARDSELPLSFAQERLWFLDQLHPGDPAYNIPAAVRLQGRLDTAKLQRTFSELIRQHEPLRTIFAPAPGGPIQVISPPTAAFLPAIDLGALPEPLRETEMHRRIQEESERPFDLGRGPLLRLLLVALAQDDHVLLLNIHHIVADGWSLSLLVRDFVSVYGAPAGDEARTLSPLPLQYADFAVWQRGWLTGEVLEGQLRYWRKQLAGLPPSLSLPTDRPRPAVRRGLGGRCDAFLPAEQVAALRRLGQKEGATLFMLLAAAWGSLLGRAAGQPDVPIGTPIANRNRIETEPLFGFFVNTLVIRVRLHGDPSFRELLTRVRRTALGAYAHQDIPFEKIVEHLAPERNLGQSPLFQALLAVQNAPRRSLELPGLRVEMVSAEASASKFDLGLTFVDAKEGMSASLSYDKDLFDVSTLQRWLAGFLRLLEGAAAEPEQRLGELPLLGEEERLQILVEWNDTASAYPGERSIHRLFSEQAAANPGAVALELGDETLTYAELDSRSDRLARHLRAKGVGPESAVGILAERSFDLIAGLLGILKAGGYYLPVDPQAPLERSELQLGNAGAGILLAPQRSVSELSNRGLRGVLALESTWQQEGDGAPLASSTAPGNLAYLLYTSGSTGVPKGVGVPHQAVVRLVRGNDFAELRGETFLHLAPLAFDASTLEIWGPLLNGGRLVLMPPGAFSLEELGTALRRHRITTLWLTAGLFHQMVEHRPDDLAGLRQLLAGGDVLSPARVQAFRRRELPVRLINGYGPTESTTFAVCHPVGRERAAAPGSSVPIGRPIRNTRTYILDADLDLQPMGAPGELYLGGDGLARGYHGRPDLTAERFVPSPFGPPGARCYRTGDQARWLSEGNLEFLGRLDNQVKIRGFRIEPGEIESVLTRHPEVREAAVVLQESVRAGMADKNLAAFVVPAAGSAPSPQQIREHLRRSLPEPLVPAGIHILESLPLTPNGKVDREALSQRAPEPDTEPQSAPRTPVEELLVELFGEVLGKKPGIHDSFFELGGHSLLATQLAARISALFGVELPLRVLFETPTVAGLAVALEEILKSAEETSPPPPVPPIEPVSREGELPLSFAQERLWFLDQLQPGSSLYNVALAVRLLGALDVPRLERTFGELIRRHEPLRTTFGSGSRGPVQVIAPPASGSLPVVDLQGLPEARRAAETARLVQEDAGRPFDLSRGPIFRTSLLATMPEEHVLLLDLHHIVVDDWSLGILVRDLAAVYRAPAGEEASALPPLPVQYADFAVWQRAWLTGDVLERQLHYWQEQLAGLPPLLPLPVDRPRPAAPSGAGGHHAIHISGDLTAALKKLGQREGATPFMTLMAAFGALLGRYTHQEDIPVGTPIANRNRLETEGLLGFFVNTLVLRVRLQGDPSFRELLTRVRRTALGAFAHQDLPFERLVERFAPDRTLSHTPLFQAMLSFQNAPKKDLELPGLRLERVELELSTSKFDFSIAWGETPDGWIGLFEYNRDLFDPATMVRAGEHLRLLLAGAAVDPALRLGDLPLLTAAERSQAAVEWNDTQTSFPEALCLHELFEAQAMRTPDAVAVIEGEGEGTERILYGDLDRRADRLAHRLRALGVGPEVPVGLYLDRSIALLAGLLGILKAGGAYVALDPDYPEERLRYIAQDAGLEVVLTRRPLADQLPFSGLQKVFVEEADDRGTAPPAGRVASGVTSGNAAYLLYTSGSTGRPKGVAVPHRGVVNHTLSAIAAYGIGPGDRVLQFSSINFDASAEEIYPPLSAGGTLVLRSAAMVASPEAFFQGMERLAVHVASLPTAYWHELAVALAERPLPLPAALRTLILGGERALPERLADWRSAAPRRIRLVNTYGPTEATIVATRHDLGSSELPPSGELPIGRPLHNAAARLFGPALELVPAGVPGEVFLGGTGVARGYLGLPALTAERFLPDPGSPEPGARLYRTGDLARHLPDGTLEFLGRADLQVKIRGFRIELGEVETALRRHPAVFDTAVVAHRQAGDNRLVAYVVLRNETDVPVQELRDFLQRSLPGFMVPSLFVSLPSLPKTPGGKIDRRGLPEPDLAGLAAGPGFVAPRGGMEELVAGLWSEVLGRERIGAHDDFFAAGGHSLLATQVISRLRRTFGIEVPLGRLFEAPTVAGFAAVIESAVHEQAGLRIPPILPAPRGADLPLSFAQERLWFLDQLQPGGTLYNMPSAARLTGRVDPARLAAAFGEVIRKHEILRTSFAARPDGPVQVISATGAVRLPVIDLGALPEPRRESEARRLIQEEAGQSFDLQRGPLLRLRLLALAPEEHILVLDLHHIVADGWSAGILAWDFAAAYRGATLPPLAIQYADFAIWQRGWLTGEVLERQLRFWEGQLAGAPPLLDLPADRPRPAVRSGLGGRRNLLLPEPLSAALRELGKRESATLFMTLLAGFGALLGRFTHQSVIPVGAPVANRNRLEIEPLIGFFVNTLVIPVRLEDDPSFREILGRVRRAALGAYTHQDLPFERLVEHLAPERALGHTPLFQVMLDLENAPAPGPDLSGLSFAPVEIHGETAKFDLSLSWGATPLGLQAQVEFSRELFDEATVGRLLERLRLLLAGAVADPDRRLADFPLLTEAEAAEIARWNDTAAAFPSAVCLHEMFEAQVDRAPLAVAAIDGEERILYRDLEARANQLAHRLRALGAGPDRIVGVCLERSIDLLVGLLGVLKAGSAYLALDPSYPSERLRFMVQDAGAALVVTRRSLAGLLPADGFATVDLDPSAMAGLPVDRPARVVAQDNLAYLLYTSGSTGRPKGVLVPHRGLVNHTASAVREYEIQATDHVLQFASANFDTSAEEIYPAFAAGATLVLRNDDMISSPASLLEAVDHFAISVLDLPTAYWHELAAGLGLLTRPLPASLRLVIIGGEMALPERLVDWHSAARGVRLVNTYGPTEATIVATRCDLTAGSSSKREIPIGSPLQNVRAHLVGPALEPVPPGVTGEILLGGAGLTRGYQGLPALTAERFLPDPFASEPGERLYRTGDLGRQRPDGDLEFLGRTDNQVKIRGFRVELGEIEAVLRRHPLLSDAVVVAHRQGEDSRLAAYVVPQAGSEGAPSGRDLQTFLQARLPEPMIPASFRVLQSLPLTASGKIDRRSLPAPEPVTHEDDGFVAPATETERRIAALWQEVLGTERIGALDNFFQRGGHSLLAVRTVARIRQDFGQTVPLTAFFQAPTVQALARFLQTDRVTQNLSALVPIQPVGSLPPFFCVHPVGGNVICYAGLAQALGERQPFYGLQAPGLEGRGRPLQSIEEMAAVYVRSIRGVQPGGPYRLGGWSFGGVVAYEMARQLREAGQEVALLALIDSYLEPEPNAVPRDEAAIASELLRDLAELAGRPIPKEFQRQARKWDARKLLRRARREGFLPAELEDEPLGDLLEVYTANLQASISYVPQPYPGRALLFLAPGPDGSGSSSSSESAAAWTQLALGGLETRFLPGDHYSLLRVPHVQVLAGSLAAALEEVAV